MFLSTPGWVVVLLSCTVDFKSMNDLRAFNGDVQCHASADHVLDGSSWYSSQPYHTCTLPYGHADTALANARVPTYAAGTRQHVDQRCVCASPTENHLNSTKTK